MITDFKRRRTARFQRRTLVAIAFTAIFIARNAFACGASTGGVAGLSACSVDEHDEQLRAKWSVGASISYTSTGIRFDDVRPDETRISELITLETLPFPRLAIQVGAGESFNQTLATPTGRYNTPSGGVIMALGGSYRLLDARGVRPFVLATLGLTMTSSQTESENNAAVHSLYNAFDARGGAVVGWSIGNFSPYLTARAFGGPVYWTYQNQKETGTDVYHYQVGAGLGWGQRNRSLWFVEAAPFGEVGISGGVSLFL